MPPTPFPFPVRRGADACGSALVDEYSNAYRNLRVGVARDLLTHRFPRQQNHRASDHAHNVPGYQHCYDKLLSHCRSQCALVGRSRLNVRTSSNRDNIAARLACERIIHPQNGRAKSVTMTRK
jgi:hypothetical protein